MDRASIVRAGGQTRARFRRLNRTCSGAPPSPPGRRPFASMKAWFVFAALLAAPLPAAAQWANIASDVNLREGPGTDHAVVAWVGRGTHVNVVGCLADGPWCEIVWGRRRGWVKVTYLRGIARDRVPTVTFDGPVRREPLRLPRS